MVRETRTTLSLAGKKPGAARVPQLQELFFAEEPGSDMRPYDRLIGAALDGNRLQFAGQDAVGAAWRVVDPVLGDVVPVHLYARGRLGAQGGRRPAARRLALARPGRLSDTRRRTSWTRPHPATNRPAHLLGVMPRGGSGRTVGDTGGSPRWRGTRRSAGRSLRRST